MALYHSALGSDDQPPGPTLLNGVTAFRWQAARRSEEAKVEGLPPRGRRAPSSRFAIRSDPPSGCRFSSVIRRRRLCRLQSREGGRRRDDEALFGSLDLALAHAGC